MIFTLLEGLKELLDFLPRVLYLFDAIGQGGNSLREEFDVDLGFETHEEFVRHLSSDVMLSEVVGILSHG